MTTIQQIQQLLGVTSDGEWGPVSQDALNKAVRQALSVPSSPIPTTNKHPFIVAAAPWMGKAETSRNRFDGDAKLWADTSYPDGYANREPYCAAFQCHVVAEAARAGTKVQAKPTSASVSEFRNWARAHGFVVKAPQPGDHFTLLPSGTSHMGLVESVDGDVIHTMEGNTDGAGSRDGDGFWRKTRKIVKCDFIRIPIL